MTKPLLRSNRAVRSVPTGLPCTIARPLKTPVTEILRAALSKLHGSGSATNGPVIEGVVIAVEAGASAGVVPACCAQAADTGPSCQAADAATITAATRDLADKARVIRLFPSRSCGSSVP